MCLECALSLDSGHPLVHQQNGSPIFWRGHLCEGGRMAPNTFVLWTARPS